METTALIDLLSLARTKGVRLWAVDGRLHYKAPKDALTGEELETLRRCKSGIVALLERGRDPGIGQLALQQMGPSDQYPLSFTQMSHWNASRLQVRPGLRQMAAALRLRGRLDVNALRAGVFEVTRRHDALRTQIVLRDGAPTQKILSSWPFDLIKDDLTRVPQDVRDNEIFLYVDDHILQSINLAVDPLFGVRLLKLSKDEHVLIVAMEHIISDARSLNIALREIFICYEQSLAGVPYSLPPVAIQFADYVLWHQARHGGRDPTHRERWYQQLDASGRLRFPVDPNVRRGLRNGWGAIPIRIGKIARAQMLAWCRSRGTTLVMGAFTIYVGLVYRWCKRSRGVIQFAVDGRDDPKVDNTIGYFASVLYLDLSLDEGDGYTKLLGRVIEAYCQAHDNADGSYLQSRVPRPEVAGTTAFNWVPQGPQQELSTLDSATSTLVISDIPFEHPMLKTMERDDEPSLVVYDTGEELDGTVYFPRARFGDDTMARFARNFSASVDCLFTQPERPLKDVPLI